MNLLHDKPESELRDYVQDVINKYGDMDNHAYLRGSTVGNSDKFISLRKTNESLE